MASEEKKDEAETEAAAPVNEPTPHQKYLENLLGGDNPAPVFNESVNPSVAVTDEGYVATDPIYQNHANDTEKPYQAEGGGDQLAEEAYFESVEGGKNEAGEALKAAYADVTHTDPEPEPEPEPTKAPAKAATKGK